MECQEQYPAVRSVDWLASEAMKSRIQALSEYLAVYRAEARERRRARNLRELRHDIRRLEAWRWYLDAARRQPRWWHLLRIVSAALGQRPHDPLRRAGKRGPGMLRLSAYSVIDRAYAALMEDCQGCLLALSLRRDGGDPACRGRLADRVAGLNQLRAQLADEAERVAVICAVLGLVQRCASWFGLHPGALPTVGS